MLLQSCVIHWHKKPFICFDKKCRQARAEHRHFDNKTPNNSTKVKRTKGETARRKVRHKKEVSHNTSNASFQK
jgi:hypothetical protein